MQTPHPLIRLQRTDRPLLLILCLLISLLLHLVIVISLPWLQEQTGKRYLSEKPTIVRLVDRPEPKPKRDEPAEYELDQLPKSPDTRKPEDANRLADRNQRVEKEQAPKGVDSKDQQAQRQITTPPAPKTTTSQQQRSELSRQIIKAEDKPGYDKRSENLLDKHPLPSSPAEGRSKQAPAQLPTLEQLTSLPPTTMDRLARTGKSAMDRIKERKDVEEGDVAWLNLEEGLLISFFQRFRNQIEGVWNYPTQAAEKGVEGVLLLKITVDRNGELLDVDLMKTSGSDLLDYEAIQAVYRGAPFGPLPKPYPYPDLKIYAHFRYMITSKFIYGR